MSDKNCGTCVHNWPDSGGIPTECQRCNATVQEYFSWAPSDNHRIALALEEANRLKRIELGLGEEE